MSYFNGEEGYEKANLAYSYDGLNWQKLDKSEGYLKTELGTQRIRDPYIGRAADGSFIVLSTQGYNTDSIYCWKTDDLVQFVDHQLVRMSYYDSHLKMSGSRAWAPEFYYHPSENQYYLIFSDPGDLQGGMYFVTTKDFCVFFLSSTVF